MQKQRPSLGVHEFTRICLVYNVKFWDAKSVLYCQQPCTSDICICGQNLKFALLLMSGFLNNVLIACVYAFLTNNEIFALRIFLFSVNTNCYVIRASLHTQASTCNHGSTNSSATNRLIASRTIC